MSPKFFLYNNNVITFGLFVGLIHLHEKIVQEYNITNYLSKIYFYKVR